MVSYLLHFAGMRDGPTVGTDCYHCGTAQLSVSLAIDGASDSMKSWGGALICYRGSQLSQ
jgi:hypothetical protein